MSSLQVAIETNNITQKLSDKPQEIDLEVDTSNIFFKYLSQFADLHNWTNGKHLFLAEKNSVLNDNIYLENILSTDYHHSLVLQKIHSYLGANQYFAFKLNTAENIKSTLIEKLSDSGFKFYYPFHFLLRRVLPKVNGLRKIHRLLKISADISKAEILGKLVYYGFDIVDVADVNNETVIVSKLSTGNPSLSKPQPSEGVLFRMQRLGKNSEQITVYKFRSMHPYSEYIQDYVFTQNGIDVGGKFKHDFRISTGGRIIRKYWIDELPMLYNLIKGDIKLVGVRPISQQYFNMYPTELQEIRKNHKPGLLPPFYADLPKTFQEIVDSEMTYLKAYQKAPFTTDFKYLMRILNNIFIKMARSQ